MVKFKFKICLLRTVFFGSNISIFFATFANVYWL